ncbi:MAG: glycoside hydrolase family 18 [Candidatus Cryptobacteroides sp.]
MKRIANILLYAASAIVLASCVKVEALEIQGVNGKVDGKLVNADKMSEEYYANVRAFKKTPHVLSFGFYTSWHNLEGSYGEIASPASYGQRLLGLPDSLDVVDLWMGLPSNDPKDPDYSPRSWQEMKWIQKNLGTKFVFHADASHNQAFKWAGTFSDGTVVADSLYFDILNGKGTIEDGHGLTEDDPVGGGKSSGNAKKQACYAYAHLLLDKLYATEMDGIDIDYEPNDATWNSITITYVSEEIGYYIGLSEDENYPERDNSKTYMLNFFGAEPGSGVAPFVDLVVNQCYAWQIGTNTDSWVARRPSWCPAEKFILCDSLGGELDNRQPNGSGLGGMKMSYNGVEMYSLEAMARTAKDNGLGGFGAYYMDRNYNSVSGIPFNEFRRAIQIANGNIE